MNTFRFRFTGGTWNPVLDTPKHKDRFAVWGHIATLDTPGEFFVDRNGINGPAHTLYVWLPDSGAPHGRDWALLSRSLTVNVGNHEHVVLENLNVLGGAVVTGNESSSIVFDGIEVDFGAINRNLLIPAASVAVHLNGSGHIFRNGRVSYTDGRAIVVHNTGHAVYNNVVYESTSHLLSLDSMVEGDVRWNTAFNAGNTAVAMGAKASYIGFNHVYNAGMRITDVAIMNTWNSGDMQGTEIAYNWAHTNLAPWDSSLSWWGGQGIRLDSGEAPLGCSNALIHHNVVWGTTSASGITAWGLESGMLNYLDSKIFIYQNTIDANLVLGGRGSNGGTVAARNIAIGFHNAVGSLDGASVHDNLFAQSSVQGNLTGGPEFISPANRNYRLRSYSPAYNVTVPIPGITEPGAYAYLGAYNPDLEPWRPGARVRPRDLAGLTTRFEEDGLGNWWLVVDNAPLARTFPDSFTVQLGSIVLTEPLVSYYFTDHRTSARFALGALPHASVVPVSVSLDGLQFTQPAEALIPVPQPQAIQSEPVFTTAAGAVNVQLQLININARPLVRFPLAFSGLTSHDLVRDAVPWVVDTSAWHLYGLRSDGADLRFLAADGVTPLRFHVEYGLGNANTLIWLLRDASVAAEAIANFTDKTIIYVAFGDGKDLHADDPAVLTDSFPALGSDELLLHLRATAMGTQLADGAEVTGWLDGSRHPVPVFPPAPAFAPTWRSNTFAGLPAVQFDGTQHHLLVNGSVGLGTGAGRFFIVYRNPDPGLINWQRLVSGRSDTSMQDWVDGYAAIVLENNGQAIAHPNPVILDYNRPSATASRANFTIAKRALFDAEWFRGEVAEIVGFNGGFLGELRDGLLRYLRRKHNIIQRPTAAFSSQSALPAFTVAVGGVPVTGLTLDDSGMLNFELPDLSGFNGSPVPLDIVLQLNNGSSITLDQAVWLGTVADVWRMQYFGPEALLATDTMANGSHWLADPDGDGRVNLLEFAFATNPLDPASFPVTELERDGQRFSLNHPPAHEQTTVTLEVSHDMLLWRPADPAGLGDFTPSPNLPLFWRLKVELNE